MMTVHMLWLFYVTLFIHNAEEIVRGAMAIFSCLRMKKNMADEGGRRSDMCTGATTTYCRSGQSS